MFSSALWAHLLLEVDQLTWCAIVKCCQSDKICCQARVIKGLTAQSQGNRNPIRLRNYTAFSDCQQEDNCFIELNSYSLSLFLTWVLLFDRLLRWKLLKTCRAKSSFVFLYRAKFILFMSSISDFVYFLMMSCATRSSAFTVNSRFLKLQHFDLVSIASIDVNRAHCWLLGYCLCGTSFHQLNSYIYFLRE